MTGWLIYNMADAKRNEGYIRLYFEEGRRLGIHFQLILVEKLHFGIRDSQNFITYDKDFMEKPEFAICRTIYPLLSKQLEIMGIPLFNNSMVAEICNDKAKTYQYLAGKGIPLIPTEFCKNEYLMQRIVKQKDQTVIKAVDGHGGSQVFLKHNEEESDKIVKGMQSSDAVFQPLTGRSHEDVRVYVIGKEIIAAICRKARSGFKSNYSLGGEVKPYHLQESEMKIIEKVICEFQFGMVGIDFLIGDDGSFLLNEIEDVVGARMLYQCTEINLVQKYLQFIINEIGNNIL